MFTESLFTSITAVYFVLMGMVSVAGTAAFLKLIVEIMKNEPRQKSRMEWNVEDA